MRSYRVEIDICNDSSFLSAIDRIAIALINGWIGELALSRICMAHWHVSLSYVGFCAEGYALLRRMRTFSGSAPVMALRKMPFSMSPTVFISQGMFQTYSTSRQSQNGTRTSKPVAMLIRSLRKAMRSEERTSELQSHLNLVCRL